MPCRCFDLTVLNSWREAIPPHTPRFPHTPPSHHISPQGSRVQENTAENDIKTMLRYLGYCHYTRHCEERLLAWRANHPIADRGDICTLRAHFDHRRPDCWRTFIFAWALREPRLVDGFYDNGGTFAGWCPPQDVKYRFTPALLVRHVRPQTLLTNWVIEPKGAQTIARLARLLGDFERRAVDPDGSHGGNGCVLYKLYKKITRTARQLRGVGVYASEHLFRTACLMLEVAHPSPLFVVMGSGADRQAYDVLRHAGISNLAILNAVVREVHTGAAPFSQIDAGELGYLVCMSGARDRTT